jgi:hypothetical protein
MIDPLYNMANPIPHITENLAATVTADSNGPSF